MTRRLRECVENWPEAETGGYDPRCCRFPKSCSATVYDEGTVADSDLEADEDAIALAESADLLTLVKRWGDQMYRLGAANTAGGDADRARQVSQEAGALMRQIRATPLPAAPCSRCEPAESGPLVLTLPVVPPEAVALVGERPGGGSIRFIRHPRFAGWISDDTLHPEDHEPLNTGTVLELFGPVTVEMAPPREPRTWEQLDEVDKLPFVVEVKPRTGFVTVWRRPAMSRDFEPVGEPDGRSMRIEQLRYLGQVREVLE